MMIIPFPLLTINCKLHLRRFNKYAHLNPLLSSFHESV